MFKKVLASMQIGSAKVDAVLDKTVFRQEEEIEGLIEIEGGDVEQEIKEIHLQLLVDIVGDQQLPLVWQEQKIDSIGMIAPYEKRSIPFTFPLADTVPITTPNYKIFLRTELAIDYAIDPKDRDAIEVKPHPYLELAIETLKRLDLELSYVGHTTEYADDKKVRICPFHQEFIFSLPGQYDFLSDVTLVNFGGGAFALELHKQRDEQNQAVDDRRRVTFTVGEEDLQDGGTRLATFFKKQFEQN
jgi:sporulation-control protein